MAKHGFESIEEARALLVKLGASERLVRHTVLVAEAAEIVLRELALLGVGVDTHFVGLGVVFHDTGKIEHPSELAQPGHEHEADGERLLLRAGVDAAVARCCLSHARWAQMTTSFEELLVALADTLWKGKRNAHLEKVVVERAAALAGKPFWDLFVPLDTCFERVATGGAERLARS
jgi:HD superfamily phosphodiesterase